jgi:hypothetical protein
MDQSVVVSSESFASAEPHDIVVSNVAFVNALREGYLREEEISRDALRSYCVDYYVAQIRNGGFSQLVWNSRWSPVLVALVREGLCAMKADRHFALFEENVALVDRMGPERLQSYLRSEYWGTNAERDALGANDDRFYKLSRTEDLTALNAAWLRRLPGLCVKPAEDVRAEIERRVAALPDLEERKRAARENEPRFMKLVRALSLAAGHELVRMTTFDPDYRHDGKRVPVWHFITDKGHHYMVDADGRAIMFDGATNEPVVEIAAP